MPASQLNQGWQIVTLPDGLQVPVTYVVRTRETPVAMVDPDRPAFIFRTEGLEASEVVRLQSGATRNFARTQAQGQVAIYVDEKSWALLKKAGFDPERVHDVQAVAPAGGGFVGAADAKHQAVQGHAGGPAVPGRPGPAGTQKLGGTSASPTQAGGNGGYVGTAIPKHPAVQGQTGGSVLSGAENYNGPEKLGGPTPSPAKAGGSGGPGGSPIPKLSILNVAVEPAFAFTRYFYEGGLAYALAKHDMISQEAAWAMPDALVNARLLESRGLHAEAVRVVVDWAVRYDVHPRVLKQLDPTGGGAVEERQQWAEIAPEA